MIVEQGAGLLVAYAVFTIGAASPGPATLAIAHTSMVQGRQAGLLFASGVISGSLVWGTVCAIWLVATQRVFPDVTNVLRWLGAAYLVFLAIRSLRAALAWYRKESMRDSESRTPSTRQSQWLLFLTGLGIHLTNPKAAFVWTATILVGVPDGTSAFLSMSVVAGCGLLGILVFSTYALLFSKPTIMSKYLSAAGHIGLVASVLYLTAAAALFFA